ncbi:hypothetical protein MKS87_11160 [Bacillus subtilis]|mgnify:CR=1 FL=1|uniref:hypothetical protein n=1 Tax=Bacillus subtilis TaxID=1423 RepID=UPI001F085FCD|nr:hypothetical protein [Bacillus subtilis]UML50946.1 hypothetical protein MKS87_11160 [Bacillus subtilis]
MYKRVLVIGSVVSIFLGLIGFLSDFVTLTEISLVNWIQHNLIESIIMIILIVGIVYLFGKVNGLIKENDNLVNEVNRLNSYMAGNLSDTDKKLLKQFNESFSDQMFYFFELLQDSRQIIFDQVNDFENNIKWFSSPQNKFMNDQIEKSKNNFLKSFSDFLDYFFVGTIVTGNNGFARFKAASEKEEQIYKDKLENLYNNWAEFCTIVKQESPKFDIHREKEEHTG